MTTTVSSTGNSLPFAINIVKDEFEMNERIQQGKFWQSIFAIIVAIGYNDR
jgi:hypothetical protein